jgi:hypothetical protein
MNIKIPTLKTLYSFKEIILEEGQVIEKQHLTDIYEWDEYNTIEHEVARIAEYECDFDIPYNNHHVQGIGNENYEIQIWNEGWTWGSKPDRIIHVKTDNVLAFGDRYFKLGEEVIV